MRQQQDQPFFFFSETELNPQTSEQKQGQTSHDKLLKIPHLLRQPQRMINEKLSHEK